MSGNRAFGYGLGAGVATVSIPMMFSANFGGGLILLCAASAIIAITGGTDRIVKRIRR
jgi:hypothetical protein